MVGVKLTVSVIVPTYKEAESIQPFVERLYRCLSNLDFELIIVDDSTNNDTEIAARTICEKLELDYRIVRRGERGKGSAIREGLKLAKGEQIVVIDADLEYPPEEIKPMLEKLKQGDAVTSIRMRKNTFMRRILSMFFRMLVLFLFQIPFETQSGLKVLNKKARNIKFDTKGWSWDAEFLYKCRKNNLKILLHELQYTPRKMGKSKIHPLKTSLEMFIELFKVRLKTLWLT